MESAGKGFFQKFKVEKCTFWNVLNLKIEKCTFSEKNYFLGLKMVLVNIKSLYILYWSHWILVNIK